MPNSTEKDQTERLAVKLKGRLIARPTSDGIVYTLDLRARQFTGAPSTRITLRCPQDAGWPERGRTTDNEDEARRWIDERYADWLARELNLSAADTDRPLTVRQAAQRFVDSLVVIKRGPNGERVEWIRPKDRSMVSMLRRHVVPHLGPLPFAALTPEQVGRKLDALQVRKTVKPGVRARKLAATGTQRRFLAALSAIWRHSYPYRPLPFAGVRVRRDVVDATDSDEVGGWDDESMLLGDEKTGALTREQLLRALVAGMYLDQELLRRRRYRFVPNTAHAMAVQAALGPRISEETNLRWGHIYSKGYVILQNAKQHQVIVKKRAVPVQLSLEPWLDELRDREGDALEPNGFVIRTNPRGGPRARAAATTLAARISRALELAGLKTPGKASHGLRATFASHADACPDVDGKMVQRYLGHLRVYGTSTDDYVRQMVGMIRDSHRRIIDLPTPDEVRAELPNFKPAPIRPWKDRRRPQSRTASAKEERRQRGARRSLGTSLDLPDPEQE